MPRPWHAAVAIFIVASWGEPSKSAMAQIKSPSHTVTASNSAKEQAKPLPAEEARLSTALFREGLKKRGLTDLLDLHLKEYPPTSPSEVLMMTREVRLAEFADQTRPPEARRTALIEANRILERLILDHSGDSRSLEWRLMLARSLLYEEGEAFATNILYFGGSPDDRRELASSSTRAVKTLRDLVRELAAEFERIDKLSATEFARIENSGLIEQLDRLDPAANYLLLWSLFYDALHRPESDSVRVSQLNEIVSALTVTSAFLKTPQERSHVQIPAHLLAGMAARRLNDFTAARRFLDGAAGIAERLTEADEIDRMQWAISLAALESARTARDDGRFDPALAEIHRLRSLPGAKGPENYGIRAAAALLEQSVLSARAEAANKAGRANDAARDREAAWRAVATLAAEEPDCRDALYAMLYRTLKNEPDKDRAFDPVETSALIAGLLRDATLDDRNAPKLLDQAASVAERFLNEATGAARAMTPEVLYNLAVTHFRRGELAAAAQRMLEVARDHPNFQDASQAAVVAVQLSADLVSTIGTDDMVSKLYLDALRTLVNKYPTTEAARYWHFFLAQQLEESGQLELAAEEYARIDRRHELHLECVLGRLRSLAKIARGLSGKPSGVEALLRRADEINSCYRELVSEGGGLLGRPPDDSRDRDTRRVLAEARILLAESMVLPGIDRSQSTIDVLADIESAVPDFQPYAARVWRSRLQAFEQMGRLDEAAKAVPAYVAADPQNAGSTLLSLYSAMTQDAERLRGTGDESAAKARSDVALFLAEHLNEWATRTDSSLDSAQRRELRVQLAEALLNAGKHAAAKERFAEELPPAGVEESTWNSTDVRVIFGRAEAMFRLGEFAEALAGFNRLATGLPPQHAVRWKALQRDLECRTSLHHPPDGILKVIAQQRRLYPHLGGPPVAAELDRLERENLRRNDSP